MDTLHILGALIALLLIASIFIPESWWDHFHRENPEPDDRPKDTRRMPWETSE